MINIFKQLRELIKDLKKDFFEARVETEVNVLNWFNFLVIFATCIFSEFIVAILCLLNLEIIGLILALLTLLYLILALNTQVFKLTGRFSYKLLFKLFGRYGKVVNAQDWKNIKIYNKKHNEKKGKNLYKCAITKKSEGKCYYFSRYIALFLKDAEIMYCSQKIPNGLTGHAVIVKNNCIYDTTNRKHYDYNEYIKLYDIKIYKMFSKDQYNKDSFFDDIRDGFVEWCAERNAYCNPE